jgi:hypothetical protein
MSNALLPTFRGLTWNVIKQPTFDTIIQTSASGREVRVTKRVNPIWEFEFTYSILDDTFTDASGYSELRDLMGFFLQRQGAFDSFLYQDPTDKSMSAQAFAPADGSTKAFQLARNFGGFLETIQNPVLPLPVGAIQQQVAYGGVASKNYLQYSQAFSNAVWSANQVTVTDNAIVAPDGTTTASSIVANGGATDGYLVQNAVAPFYLTGTYTFSIWLKVPSGTLNTSIWIKASGPNIVRVQQAVSLTTSWQRFTATAIMQAGDGPPQVLIAGGASFTTGTIHAWGAQLEDGSTVSPGYIATTSPAFYYACGRENLLLNSQDFTQSAWSKSGVVATANTQVAPDGTTTAATLAFSAAGLGVFNSIAQIVNGYGVAGQPLTFSIWLRAAAPVSVLIRGDNGFPQDDTTINITTAWQRFSVTVTPAFSSNAISAVMYITNQAATTIYAWGSQFERGSVPTDYLPTASTPATGNGLVTFSVAPPAVYKTLLATFSFYYRVRFKEDMREFNNFLNNLWETKQMRLISVKI